MSSLKNESVTEESIKEEGPVTYNWDVYGGLSLLALISFVIHLYFIIDIEGPINSGHITLIYLSLGIFSILGAISFYAGVNDYRNFKRHLALMNKIDEMRAK